MKLAYKRYGGDRGFTPEQFRLTAQEIAGVDLKEWFRKNISSTEELDYTEEKRLVWPAVRTRTCRLIPKRSKRRRKSVKLEIRDDASRRREGSSQEADRTRLGASNALSPPLIRVPGFIVGFRSAREKLLSRSERRQSEPPNSSCGKAPGRPGLMPAGLGCCDDAMLQPGWGATCRFGGLEIELQLEIGWLMMAEAAPALR